MEGESATLRGVVRLVFLDVDGVICLDPMSNGLDAEALNQLKRIVTETGAKIVLSSTWRRSDKSMAYLNDVFKQTGTLKATNNSTLYDSLHRNW